MNVRSTPRKLNSLLSIFGMHRTVRVFLAVYTDRRVSLWLKVSALSGLIYIFSPLDVMPDVSGIGLLDDIIISLLIMQAFLETAPKAVVDEHLTRLKINPEAVFVNVPRTVNDALELYRWAAEKGFAIGTDRQQAPQPPTAPAEPPPYSRYSAFSDNKE